MRVAEQQGSHADTLSFRILKGRLVCLNCVEAEGIHFLERHPKNLHPSLMCQSVSVEFTAGMLANSLRSVAQINGEAAVVWPPKQHAVP